MTSKIWLYNHWGELEEGGYPISTTPRSWVLNGYGRTDFAIPLSDGVMLKEKYLRAGNFVRITHYPNEDEGRTEYGVLPEWVGMIIPAKSWNKDAVVVSAVSIEALLAYRAMPFVKVEGTPDVVFKAIIGYATSSEIIKNESIPLSIGRVDTAAGTSMGGVTLPPTPYADELRTNAYDHIGKMIKTTGMDWDITHTVTSSGALALKANLYAKKGREGLVLTPKNSDDQSPLLTEQGTIVNHIFGYNQAQTEATRVMQEIKDDASINKYGPFQSNVIFTGVTEGGRLSASTQSRANSTGEPTRMVSRTALDFEDTFSFIAPGNICYVYDPRVGFNADGSLGFRSWARILSADYNDTSNKCALHISLISRSVPFPDPESFFS